MLYSYWSPCLFSGHVQSGFRTENLHAYFCNAPSPCTTLLSNNSFNKARKFIGHTYTYYSNSATCFGILCRLLGNHCISHLLHLCCSLFHLILVDCKAVMFSGLVTPHRHCQEVVLQQAVQHKSNTTVSYYTTVSFHVGTSIAWCVCIAFRDAGLKT
jgi:hypothetical protein